MSSEEYKKLRRTLRYLIIAVLLFIFLVSAGIVHTLVKPSSNSFPLAGPQGPKGDTAQVDYNLIVTLVKKEISQFPLPQNGTDGKPGIVGPPGAAGQPGSNGVDGLAGKDGSDGQVGLTGDPGVPGSSVELRTNPTTGNIEWKLTDDILWTVLIKKCEITNTCEVL